MRRRPSARLIVREPGGRILLFRFEFILNTGKHQNFWGTPGGGVDEGESYEQAAARELREETGLIAPIGREILHREAQFTTPDNVQVIADERFYLVETTLFEPHPGEWTDLERSILKEWRWWSEQELFETPDQIWPEDLVELLTQN